jgi:hypothetical protein
MRRMPRRYPPALFLVVTGRESTRTRSSSTVSEHRMKILRRADLTKVCLEAKTCNERGDASPSIGFVFFEYVLAEDINSDPRSVDL